MTHPVTTVPGRIIVAGDWHCNTAWAKHVIWQAKELLEAEYPRIILHLGDFGIWPTGEGKRYLREVSAALEQADAVLWFVDGNHDDHARLAALRKQWESSTTPGGLGFRLRPPLSEPPFYVTREVLWLPRGYRWEWHDRTWLASGGAVSVDKAGPPCLRCRGGGCRDCGWLGQIPRQQGVDWWAEEEITDAQEAAIIAAGPADVLVSHDCPAKVVHAFPDHPDWWHPADLARAADHARRLQRITDATRPGFVMHGHLHMGYQRRTDFGYGPVQVTGLDRDDTRLNYAILDIRTMGWELPAA